MRYLREEKPEDGLFRMLYDLVSQLGLSPDYLHPETTPPPSFNVSQGFQPQPPTITDPRQQYRPPAFDVSQGNRPQPPTIADPRPTPPPPSFNVSQGDRPQPRTIVDPRRPQPSPGMFSPETARSVDLVRQAMLRGGFNRRR